MEAITLIEKRDQTRVKFNLDKITNAAYKAMNAVARNKKTKVNIEDAKKVTDYVFAQINDPDSDFFVEADEAGKRIPKQEAIQDIVEFSLAENGYTDAMLAFKQWRSRRKKSRKRLTVRTFTNGASQDSTDILMMVSSTTSNVTKKWDKRKIVEQLETVANVKYEIALEIAKSIENQVIEANFRTINTSLIRELANNELQNRGMSEKLKDLKTINIPISTIDTVIFSKPTENSNTTANNPEAVSQTLSELLLKPWANKKVYGAELEVAHNSGRIHIHDLGFPIRVYCSSHSLEYTKKWGLIGFESLATESNPPKTAPVLTAHLNTFLASMQAYYAGALGIGYLNILYSPLLEGASDKDLEQRAQELIFAGSQNAHSRGGQTIFLDFNIHSGVPKYMKSVPVIGPGGKYMLRTKDGEKVQLEELIRKEKSKSGNDLMELKHNGKIVLREIIKGDKVIYDTEIKKAVEQKGEKVITYGDYEEISRRFANAMLTVWEKGDANGKVFEFPKCDFHVNHESFDDPEQNKVLMKACEVASTNGSTYFIFDRDEVTLSACCRLRTTIDDNHMLLHPESMRFCGFQNVTINIPHAAYITTRKKNKTIEGVIKEIYKSMDLAMDAHLRKKEIIQKMMVPGAPQWQTGKISCDGKPYIDLEKATYIIGIIGVNDAVKYITGHEMHKSEEAMESALDIITAMNLKTKEYSKKHNLKVTLEETPAESASRRLAKQDLQYFPEAKDVIKGSIENDDIYYTNSIHLSAEADVGIAERIKTQGKFHSLIESGAITHAFVGEERPSPKSIYQLVKNTFYETQSAQLTISPEFTYCKPCKNQDRGIKDNCTQCGSDEVKQITRVVGYYSDVKNWNKSKKSELKQRQAGNYKLGSDPTPTRAKELKPILV